jgi:O-antigen biosynthesis protein
MTVPTGVSHPGTMPVPDAHEGFAPARIMDVELTEPLPAVSYDGQHRSAWVLGRLHTEPVGRCVVQLDQEGLTPDHLGALLWPELRERVSERFAAVGMPEPGALTGKGLAAEPDAWPFLRCRREVLAVAPFVSVVICTRDRPDQLEACLRLVDRIDYPNFEVIVVDSGPTSDAVPALLKARRGGVTIRYVLESRGGLSRARNAAIAATRGEIIAFLDDDAEPDIHWLAALACGFARGGDIGCVTGIVLPARLDTEAQHLFEELGGHSKGRGFSAEVFSAHGPQSPLYPLPPFGAGTNMAFRREVLSRIGGFDVALGAGTPAFAGEDTLALTLTMLTGYHIAYEPTALVRHNHRPDLDGLGHQQYGYGVGLTAYYAALLRHRPSVLPALLKLVFTAAGYLRSAEPTDTAAHLGLLTGLMRRKRRGMVAGPLAYMRSMRR